MNSSLEANMTPSLFSKSPAALFLLIGALLLCASPGRAGASSLPQPSGPVPVAFEGSALLITYYSGVTGVLLERGVIQPGVSSIAGLSGGAFTAVLTSLGFTGQQQKQVFHGVLRDCSKKWGSCVGHLNIMVDETLNALLPENVTAIVNGKVRIAVSQLNANSTHLNGSASWVVSKWSSKADLLSCLMATDHIPCWSSQNVYALFRNQPCVDGGYANGFRQLCKNASNCLTVSTYYVGQLGDKACDAKLCPQGAQSQCVNAERREPIVTTLYKNPLLVDQWELNQVVDRCPPGAYANGTGATDPYPLPDWVPQNQTLPVIHPGKWNPLPIKPWDGKRVLACEWQEWATNPPQEYGNEIFDLAYDLGVKDARSWCDESGYRMKAAARRPAAAKP